MSRRPSRLKRLYWTLRERPARDCLPALAADSWTQAQVLLGLSAALGIGRLPRPAVRWRREPASAGGDRSVIMISHFSPPYKSSLGTQRLNAFMKYLSRWGWDVRLVTTTPGEGFLEEPGGGDAIPDAVDVVRLPQVMPRVLAEEGWLVPDDFVGWVAPAVSAALNAARERRASVLFATAPPYSNLIAGAICSGLLDLPLVSDFRDPWTRVDVGSWAIEGRVRRRLNAGLEHAVCYASDAIVMADEPAYARDFFGKLADRLSERIVSITNGFDEEDCAAVMGQLTPERAGRLAVSYVGVIYDPETFQNLTMPMRIWQERHPEDLQHVVFEYAGPSSRDFDRHGFRPPYLRDHGYVAHREAIAIRARSGLQLFSQPQSFKPHVLSGKIYEMIRVGVPIGAVTNPWGAAAGLLARTGAGFVVAQGNPTEAAEVLHRLFKRWEAGETLTTVKWEVVAEYSRERLTGQFAALLERVVDERRRRRRSARPAAPGSGPSTPSNVRTPR